MRGVGTELRLLWRSDGFHVMEKECRTLVILPAECLPRERTGFNSAHALFTRFANPPFTWKLSLSRRTRGVTTSTKGQQDLHTDSFPKMRPCFASVTTEPHIFLRSCLASHACASTLPLVSLVPLPLPHPSASLATLDTRLCRSKSHDQSLS